MQTSERKKANTCDLSKRTKNFALCVIKLYKVLPQTFEAQILGKQMLRSGTSVGAQYREAIRARSRAEFLSKLESALQELEETGYWFELLLDAEIISKDNLKFLFQEQCELTAIFVSVTKNTKLNK